jgi:hypothetical protein
MRPSLFRDAPKALLEKVGQVVQEAKCFNVFV